MTEAALRPLVVKEVRTWQGTPFILGARVKGAQGGVDCFTLLAEVFHACCAGAPWESEFYTGDWWCHDTKNGYLRTILKYAKQVPAGTIDRRPGNIVLVRRRTGAAGEHEADWHGGLITTWPLVVHAYTPRVSEDNALAHPAFTTGVLNYFNPFAVVESA